MGHHKTEPRILKNRSLWKDFKAYLISFAKQLGPYSSLGVKADVRLRNVASGVSTGIPFLLRDKRSA